MILKLSVHYSAYEHTVQLTILRLVRNHSLFLQPTSVSSWPLCYQLYIHCVVGITEGRLENEVSWQTSWLWFPTDHCYFQLIFIYYIYIYCTSASEWGPYILHNLTIWHSVFWWGPGFQTIFFHWFLISGFSCVASLHLGVNDDFWVFRVIFPINKSENCMLNMSEVWHRVNDTSKRNESNRLQGFCMN